MNIFCISPKKMLQVFIRHALSRTVLIYRHTVFITISIETP